MFQPQVSTTFSLLLLLQCRNIMGVQLNSHNPDRIEISFWPGRICSLLAHCIYSILVVAMLDLLVAFLSSVIISMQGRVHAAFQHFGRPGETTDLTSYIQGESGFLICEH